MRKDLFGILTTVTKKKFIFFSSSDSTFLKTKYLFTINKNYYIYIYFLKLNSLCYNSTFVEFSCIENLNINFDLTLSFFFYYYFILNAFNTRLCLGTWTNKIEKNYSFTHLFNNLNWSEREVSEMYGINFLNKKDNRHLLLDYNFFDYPMLSTFPVQGYEEIIFNFIDQKVEYIKLLSWEGQKIIEKF